MTDVSKSHVVFGTLQLGRSVMNAASAGAAFFHGFIVAPPPPASVMPYQPCSLPPRRSMLGPAAPLRLWLVSSGSLLAPVAVSTRRTVWTNAISSASTAVASGRKVMLIL